MTYSECEDVGGNTVPFVQTLFENVAAQHGEEIALIFGNKKITYQELNKKSTRLCQTILREAGDEATIIGISTNRSIEMVIGVLAILKSGKAYLPIDPKLPSQRLNQIVSGSGAKWCICFDEDETPFTSAGLSVIQDGTADYQFSHIPASQKELAYVLYTSGSTGTPKGVSMGHRALVNLLQWQQKKSGAGIATKTLQFAPLGFDVSFQEIFATLGTGGTLVLIADEIRLDSLKLLEIIEEEQISRIFLPFIALQYLAEMAVSFNRFPTCLKEIITAGEQLKITPQIIAFLNQLPGTVLCNQYGPTECHVVSELQLTGNPATWPHLPSIGFPIENVEIFITDDELKPVPAGETGELIIAGACVAEGYLNQPDLTIQKFIQWHQPGKGLVKAYRTGDLAKYLPNGEIDFLGRKDGQVKIRGNRIELGEIEIVITRHPDIKQAVVIAREDVPGQNFLVAYFISNGTNVNIVSLKELIATALPDYMVPVHYIQMQSFPATSSGKVNRLALPRPSFKRPELITIYKKPINEIEKNIAGTLSDILQIDKVGINDNFFELGGNSLLAQKTVTTLKNQFNYNLPITKLYQFATVAGIAAFLQDDKAIVNVETKTRAQAHGNNAVAIIGMAGRFPGANTIEEFWEILKNGKETIQFFTKDELFEGIREEVKNDPLYVSARGVIKNADQFDAQFFGLNPKLAELMDPQQRIFMEIAWEVLEKTGHLPQQYKGSVGVYAGTGTNSYYINNVHHHNKLIDQVGSFQVMTANEKDYVSSRTAYQLNLKGPAVSVYSACSTSLLAIAQAVESIRSGQCNVAIAGGASITSPLNSGHLYQEGAMLSKDGHCRSFDETATGTVFSDGAGVILLKSLDAAKKDGDTIYAVIKGTGLNNDGGGKGSFTAPSADGQAAAIAMAIADADIDPATISYLEAHGTATPLGDPIEIEGLKIAFGEQVQHQYCAIGSLKSNMGHLTAAAGVAGVIKTALSLYNKQLVPSIGFSKPNPTIDFSTTPFYVNTQLKEWQAQSIRRAGVSSFGVGGTNVHVILEAYENEELTSDAGRSLQLITWSAKSDNSIAGYAEVLQKHLEQKVDINIADLAFTLQTTRGDFNNRRFVLAGSNRQLLQALKKAPIANEVNKITEVPATIAFMFPGQGSQYLGMGIDLYRQEGVYKLAVDECTAFLMPLIGMDIKDIIFPEDQNEQAAEQLKNTRYTQPAVFVTAYALAKLWMSWGIEPSVVYGHSIGEFVAAHLAGIFSLSDALTLIAGRGKIIGELPGGSMLSVRLGAAAVEELLPENISIAAINSDHLCVVAGEEKDTIAFAKALDNKGISNRKLHTSHAFHSAMMDPAVEAFEKLVSNVTLQHPRRAIVSTVTGTWMTDAEATDIHYWSRQLRQPVHFAAATNTILKEGPALFLETGPGNALSTMVRQQAVNQPAVVISSLERSSYQQSEYESMLKAMGQLWLQGLQPNWQSFYAGQQRRKINLPTYAFDRKICWVNPPVLVSNSLIPSNENNTINKNSFPQIPYKPVLMRKENLISKIKEILEDAAGIDTTHASPTTSFLEMGLDSLLLTQVALTFKKEFGLPITFRQLNEELSSPNELAQYLDTALSPEKFQPPVVNEVGLKNPEVIIQQHQAVNYAMPVSNNALELVAQQLQILAKQIQFLQGNSQPDNNGFTLSNIPVIKAAAATVTSDLTPEEAIEIKKPFGATARIDRQVTGLSDVQKIFLQELIEKYNNKTKQSKNYAQANRAQMADPRVVSGFRPLTKEIVYPLVVNKSAGSRLWDIDGNEYIDVLNGFGSSLLGFQPQIIKAALHQQIEDGFEVGPQHQLAGEVSKLVCELTGQDRAALCSTGSEAVLGAMRVARTVTGRSLIVAFSGAYHGIADEVLVRGTKKLKSFPAAPGIMPEAVQNMLILDYGTDESLRIIRERAHELAAVLVEPIQSRRPEFRPVDFLKQVRKITEASGTAFIFDEVITGFRMHPGGAQALFGIKADIASYGKVVGAGIPIGVIAGKTAWMDALDGGFWQYGDASFPEVGVTYFAGTFVRHPLALAAAKVSLQYMKDKGAALQESLNAKGDRLASELNTAFEKRKLPFFIAQFGSLWKIKFKEEVPYGELLFTLMRLKGVHVWDGFPCFMTEAHTAEEVDLVIHLFIESADEMIKAGFFKSAYNANEQLVVNEPRQAAPIPGARLGRDKEGNPAWFIADGNVPGNFLRVEING